MSDNDPIIIPIDLTNEADPLAALMGILAGEGELNVEPLGDVHEIMDGFTMMGWAEDEIAKARERHGEHDKGVLHHAFNLLFAPPVGGFQFEDVYRAHCRELLDRVIERKDTRPATDAEMLLALKETSLMAPLNSAAVTLYFRIMARALPDMWAKSGGAMVDQQQEIGTEGAQISLEAYESVHGKQADEIEAYARSHFMSSDRSDDDPYAVLAACPVHGTAATEPKDG